MEHSPNLTLPYIMPAQAQKHVTHNEAIRMLDALAQLGVLDRDLATPPAEPEDGDRYIVAEGGTGDWSGRDGDVAAWQDGAWALFSPRAGWMAWVADEARLVAFDGTQWAPAAAEATGAETFGVNAMADAINRLAVAAPATLLNHEGAGHQLKINKQAAADTASLLFQTDFSGRAEMGTAGDDDFRFKVSPDGTQWIEAIAIDRATGEVRLPQTPLREVLTAPRTYYVRADGDDGNDGLADSAGGAFATIQKAIDTVATLDLAIHDVTISVGHGTYAPFVLKSCVGAGEVTIVGDESTPTNVAIATQDGGPTNLIRGIAKGTVYRVRGLSFSSTHNNAVGISISNSIVIFRNLHFGAFSGGGTRTHLDVGLNAYMDAEGGWTVSGGATQHIRGIEGGMFRMLSPIQATVSGNPSFTRFISAARGSLIHITGATPFTGTATGQRFVVDASGMINGQNSLTTIPGDQDGIVSVGGLYGALTVVFDHGTRSSGTLTPVATNGGVQKVVNGGAHTLAPPTTPCEIVLRYTNNASAGAIATGGFTRVVGSFNTVNGDRFECRISFDGAQSLLRVIALQ